MDLKQVAIGTLSKCCDAFSPTHKIGEGATGEVFRGRLSDGTEVAVKRLHLPEHATPSARAALVRAFHAELTVLSSYRHPRLVRLLSYAQDEDPASRHPFVLAFELLEAGSLADHLRGPSGAAAPLQPPLTPLERVDAALGAAAGLAYLHGLREPGEGEGQPAAPVLHRDIKSANIGLTRTPDGGLYAKILDCGLARALKAPPPGGAVPAGASITGGVVGTLGYMSPELSTGEYSPGSDLFALGCVLLELLSGQRVGPNTARKLEEAAVEDEGGVAAVAAVAEACWPAPAAQALAALTLSCIHHSTRKRLGSAAEVLKQLRALRLLVAPAAPPLIECSVCMEGVQASSGLLCAAAPPAPKHFLCHGCLQTHVRGCMEPVQLERHHGKVPCADPACTAAPWEMEAAGFAEALDKGTLVACFRGLRYVKYDAEDARQREVARLEAQMQAARGDARRLRAAIVERDLLLRCPRCQGPFADYEGCNSLTCSRCPCVFCAVCLKDCGGDAHACAASHSPTHGVFDRALFESEARKRFLARLVAAVRAEAAGGEVLQRALVAELGKADLRDLGISEKELLEGAGVGVQAVVRGGGGGQQQQQQQQHAAGGGGVEQLVGHCVKELNHEGTVWALAVLEDGTLVSGGNGSGIRMWDPVTGKMLAATTRSCLSIAPLARGRFASTRGQFVWTAAKLLREPDLKYATDAWRITALRNDLVAGASGENDKDVNIWNSTTGASICTLEGHTDRIYALALLSNGLFASGSMDHSVRLWNLNTKTCTSILKHKSTAKAIVDLGESILASACADYDVYLWNYQSGVREALLVGHTNSVLALAALPNGLLASGSYDKTVRVWNVAARACVAVLEGHKGEVSALAALPNGRLASGSDNKEGDVIRVWELRKN